MSYHRLAARLYNTPHAIDPAAAEALEAAFRAHAEGRADTQSDYKASPHALFASGAVRSAPEGHLVTGDGIAVIQVLGTLVQRAGMLDGPCGFTSYQQIAAQIAAAEADKSVRGIVLDIDSPGGEVAGMFELADRIVASSKPVYAHANELAASAAFEVASAASKVNVAKTGSVGSVGIVMLHVDQSARDAKQGIKYTAIHAGDRKVDGNPHEPLSSEALNLAQARVDSLWDLFAESVAQNRGIDLADVKKTQGGILTADAAVAAGFADGIATLAQTVDQLRADLLQPSKPVRNRAGAAAIHQEPHMDQKDVDALVATARAEGETAGVARAASESAAAIAAATASATATKDADISAAAAKAATEARERVAAILGSEDAKGREALAQHLAFKTSNTVDDSLALLKVSPKEAAGRGGALGNLMPPNPNVAPDTADPGDATDAKAMSARIVGNARALKIIK